MSIEISNESELAVDQERVLALAGFVRDALKLHALVELGITFVDEAPMTELHIRWMEHASKWARNELCLRFNNIFINRKYHFVCTMDSDNYL